MTKKFTLDFVRRQFELKNYLLLSTEYIGCDGKLSYVCPQNHEHSISWSNWRNGKRCPYCWGKRSSELQRKDFGEIKEQFEKEGYKILTREYINSGQSLKYICPEGHRHSITWDNWKHGQRCSYCAGQNKPTIKFIESEFAKEGYILLTKKYKNNKRKLDYICSEGHRHSINWHNWYFGKRCPDCGHQKAGKAISRYWADPKYQRKMAKALNIKPNKPETFLQNLLNQLFPNEYKYVGDFQFFLGGKNPDFININSQKKLIEIFGTHWHSPKMTGLSRKQHELERAAHFKKFSFDTLIVWENELKDQERLVEKLQEFHHKEFEH